MLKTTYLMKIVALFISDESSMWSWIHLRVVADCPLSMLGFLVRWVNSPKQSSLFPISHKLLDVVLSNIFIFVSVTLKWAYSIWDLFFLVMPRMVVYYIVPEAKDQHLELTTCALVDLLMLTVAASVCWDHEWFYLFHLLYIFLNFKIFIVTMFW